MPSGKNCTHHLNKKGCFDPAHGSTLLECGFQNSDPRGECARFFLNNDPESLKYRHVPQTVTESAPEPIKNEPRLNSDGFKAKQVETTKPGKIRRTRRADIGKKHRKVKE